MTATDASRVGTVARVLRAESVSRSVGAATVLDRVSLSVDGGDRVGLVGPNGVGKTTLLRILAGLVPPDDGAVVRAPASLTVGYLPQEGAGQPGERLLDYLARRTGVAAASRTLDERTAALAGDPEAADAYYQALDTFLAVGGDGFGQRAAEVCEQVGLSAADLGQEVTTLSGGEATRAALAAILLAQVDVLLLDEPTNNLDFAGLDLLEGFVDRFAGAVLVVSHDRAFLDRSVRRIVEIHEHTHQLTEFAGGWTDYVAARELARTQQYEAHDKFVTERDRLTDRQRRQRQWSERGVKNAKTSGEPDKSLRRRRAERSEKQTSKIRATERALGRLEAVDKPWEGWRLQLQIAPSARSGDVVARLDDAVIERGGDSAGEEHGADPFVLGPIDLEIAWQDRLALVGPNGSGKSTLLGALLGTLPLASGRRWLGPGVQVGELDQSRGLLDGDETVVRLVQRLSGFELSATRSLLAKFGLGAEHVERLGSQLSPGERSRAILAVLMAQGVNCLVLDEPTNHLDLAAIEQLETALDAYEGTLIVVSHDRRFLESIALTRSVDLTPC